MQTDDPECVHGLGDPAWCTICNGTTSRAAAEAARVVHRMSARYNGRCQTCSTPIDVGDHIAVLASGAVICDACA